jgi:threonine dehydrogenase-like Zn-dependent dehydrogenase
MKALYCAPPGVRFADDAPLPQKVVGETLVHSRLAGICRTDMELTRGYMGFNGILGHEFVGEVDDDESPLPRGTRVVGEINAGCGDCSSCHAGMDRHCPNRTVLGILGRDGCMAEWLRLPHRNLLPVSDAVSDEEAVFTEPLAAALEIFEQLHLKPDDRVCVIGDGKLGLLITMAIAHRQEMRPLLLGRHSEKLQLVEDMAETALEGGYGQEYNFTWDVVVDATGSSSGLRRAMELVRPRGTIVLKSTMAHAEALDLTPLVINEVTVVGSRCGRFAPALALLERKAIPVLRLIDGVYPIQDAQTAWDKASTRGSKKILLRVAA